eukprot:21974-Chlamydomonas_euryale.AAC.2
MCIRDRCDVCCTCRHAADGTRWACAAPPTPGPPPLLRAQTGVLGFGSAAASSVAVAPPAMAPCKASAGGEGPKAPASPPAAWTAAGARKHGA